MLLLIFALFLCLSGAYAQPNLDSLVINAPGLDVYPQASAVILLDHSMTELKKDGQSIVHREFLCKILDERAKDVFGDQSVRFDADQDTVIIESARTRLPDGQWIEPEADAFTLTSAPEVQWASAYSQLKQRNVAFPGMAVGAALHFMYRIEPKPGAKPPKKPQDGGITLFGGYEPILDKRCTVITEAPRLIRHEMQNSDYKPLVSEQGGRITYIWTMQNCPQIVREPNSVGLADLVPRLVWTTFSDWEALGLYVAEWFWEKVDSSAQAVEGFLKITSPDLHGKPALMHTANWMLFNIRTVRLAFGSVGYEPNAADRVWQNKYGDPRDKAVLLTSLLRAYGFNPVPVLVQNSSTPFSNLPVLEQFRHIILAVPTESDTIWLDPTADFYTPGTLPYNATLGTGCMLTAGAPMLLNVPAGSADSRGAKTEIRTTLKLDGELTGSAVCVPQGDRAASARRQFKDQKAQERDIYTQTVASSFGQGTNVKGFTVSNVADLNEPVAVQLDFECPEFAVKQGDLMLVELPGMPFDFGSTGFYPALPQVKYPVQLPGRRRTISEVTLSIPQGYAVSFMPSPLVIDNPFVNFELTTSQEQSVIRWTQTVEIKGDKVSVADYPALRDAYEALVIPKNRMVILEKK
ncbi:DUF3857 domain-containing protein [candidate division KSB1 bacterium]|nr:MAG: DUF3857 domain-containing protein [candidate division KSB1 bacterium]